MTNEERRVANLIREAFQGVTLGDGIGLMQAQGLDDYARPETLKTYRDSDEKEDWSAIPAEKLNRCYSSLSFFDAEGMRFYLPAFLIAELRGTFCVVELVSYLSDFGRDSWLQFELLSPDQREAVRQYRLLREHDNGLEWPLIREAAYPFWTPSDSNNPHCDLRQALSLRLPVTSAFRSAPLREILPPR